MMAANGRSRSPLTKATPAEVDGEIEDLARSLRLTPSVAGVRR
jgi:hypothetical protein